MDTPKKAEEIHQPDQRNLCWARLLTGQPVTFRERYSEIVAIQLDPAVPDEIRSYFATIRNLCVYGWFDYDFYALVSFLSYTSIEMALKVRLPIAGEDRRGFRNLLEKAVKRGLIREKSFSHARRARQRQAEAIWSNRQLARERGLAYRPSGPKNEYLKVMCEKLATRRNAFAHPQGNAILFPGEALSALRFAAEFINQIFPAGGG